MGYLEIYILIFKHMRVFLLDAILIALWSDNR